MGKYCSKCGKELEDNAAFRPACGTKTTQEQEQAHSTEPMYSQQTTSNAKLNIMAIIGFVIACVSLLLNFLGIVGIVALVFSVVGLVQINGGNGKGKGFAIAGTVIGGLSVVYGVITLFMI